ncbi:MAG: hypothetical protein JWQ01_817 [Massilia sp.]|jgi:hypothetical protein|nr:hypothetical protein [Massilia sp.]
MMEFLEYLPVGIAGIAIAFRLTMFRTSAKPRNDNN